MTSRFRLTVIYAVPDFDRWAAVLAAADQEMDGVERMTVHRSIEDPNEVMRSTPSISWSAAASTAAQRSKSGTA